MNIVFLGTPDFAKAVLADLIESRHNILCVVTQPDKPVGRSGKLQAPPVKQLAQEHNIPVHQFARIKKQEAIETLKALNADVFVTAAYGQILSQAVLDIPKYGVYNVHGSLLPKYRGAAPIQWAIINGETVSGITIMKTDIGMDTGDMLLKQEIEISAEDTAGDMFEKMSKFGGKALLEALDKIEQGNIVLEKQDEAQATHFPMLKKEDGLLDFTQTVTKLVNLVRGLNPWPVAHTFVEGTLLKVYKAKLFNATDKTIQDKIDASKIGQVIFASPKLGLVVKVGDGAIQLCELQLFGGKKMSDKALLNGKKISEGIKLGE